MTNHRISINWKSGSKKNQFLTSLMTDRHLSLLEVSSVRSHSSQPNVPWCHENVETVPWLPCIWRQDRVSLLCRWKTTWYSQEKNYGQDPRKHIEDINQYHVGDLWWQRSLVVVFWAYSVPVVWLLWFVSGRFVNEIIKWLDYQSSISKSLIIKVFDNQTQHSFWLSKTLIITTKNPTLGSVCHFLTPRTGCHWSVLHQIFHPRT